MNTAEILDKLRSLALRDEELKRALLGTRQAKDPLAAFCQIASEHGCPLSVVDVVAFGEESYAAMRRSTNGGGENSPLLEWEDDYYELFLAELGG